MFNENLGRGSWAMARIVKQFDFTKWTAETKYLVGGLYFGGTWFEKLWASENRRSVFKRNIVAEYEFKFKNHAT